ncbi:MAG: carboxypeptidase-like regulatory domain-containing protein [Sediminibacterium sp.]|nr:carboxypeptidase-like regulatory domain-containing protein [uncultured Sediminibacterium sp.]
MNLGKLLIFFAIWLIPSSILAQQTLKGRVLAADTKQPIHLANVFLSNTSIGTVTNAEGYFTIEHFPQGRYDVVVSCIGYESFVTTIQSAQLPKTIDINLVPKVNILQEVIVEPYEKNGWDKYGKFFLDNFVGTSAFAKECKLKNPETIRFRYNKKENILRAFADEPIILENKALGYILKYDLKTFEYNYSTRIFYFQGYPLFEEMETGRKRLQERWENRRADAYYGSLMHFMRSLFRNQLIQEGFETRKLIKISEEEKKRVRTLYNKRAYTNGVGNIVVNDSILGQGNADSAAYYRKVMRQPEKMNVLIDKVLPGDSIAFAIDSLTAGLYFEDHLQVIYLYKQVPDEYVQANGLSVRAKSPVVSEIFLTRKNTIAVLSNGSYYEGIDLISSGYWGWWEKLATMLPYDYKPPPRKK